MLYCCGIYFNENITKRYLVDTYNYSNRILEYGVCPKCGTKKAVLTQTNIYGKRIEIKPKKRKVNSFIENCLSEKEEKKIIKNGSKQNIYWTYQRNGKIYDFNEILKGECKTELIKTHTMNR